MRYFEIKEDRPPGCTGVIDGSHRWGLPGILVCPGCKTTWSGSSKAYPSVDLTSVMKLADFTTPRPEPIEEYERLRELVRPLLPSGGVLEPGSGFGPIEGKAQGRFASLVSPVPWWLLVRREALEKLQAEGILGLKGCPTQLHFRQRTPPELLELELLPIGRAHEACLPANRKPPCGRCHRRGITLPNPLVLDASTLPSHLDVFRLEDFSTVLICTERFVTACQRLGLEGVSFHPLAVQAG